MIICLIALYVIGLIVGAILSDFITNLLGWIFATLFYIIAFIPCCIYFPIRYIINPVNPNKWEKTKHHFKYKSIGQRFFVCCEPQSSHLYTKIFFVRLQR